MAAEVSGNLSSGENDPFRQVVEWAPTAMVMVDSEGRIVLFNAQAERVFGYHREEMLGTPVEKLVPLRYAHHHPANRADFYSAPHPRPMGSGRDLYARRADGTEFPVEIGLNPIETEDGMMVVASIVDITERLRAQQRLENALQEKTVLLNEVHHRVKNNLQVVSSLLNLQASHTADPRISAILAESQSRVRAMALTHQLLYERKDYSRIDLGEYLERLAQLLLSSYRENSNQIALQRILPANPLFIDLERAIPCGLVVNELVTNAFKHAFPSGKGEVRIELQGQDDTLELAVADNGRGLPPDFSLDEVRSLGLQLVPLLADQLGASIHIDSSGGTRFCLRFPSSPAAKEA